jgi:beta-D-xylosidase 4
MTVVAAGPGLANDMLGDYHGTPPVHIKFEDGLRAYVDSAHLTVLPGCAVNSGDSSGIPAVANASKAADVVLLYLGLDGSIENEGQDRPIAVGLGLPGQQEHLVRSVVAASGAHTKIVVIVVAGGPVDLTLVRDEPKVGAILWAGYPGQAGGLAVAQTVWGHSNPSGRYPMTTYPASYNESISFYEMSMRKPPGRSYKFFRGQPVYGFGVGLSYTTFKLQWENTRSSDVPPNVITPVPQPAMPQEDSSEFVGNFDTLQLASTLGMSYRATVTNTGRRAGAYVALAFLSPPNATAVPPSSSVPRYMTDAPIRQLFDFARVFLEPQQSKTIDFLLELGAARGPKTPRGIRWSSASVSHDGKRVVQPGRYRVRVEGLVERVFNAVGTPTLVQSSL